MAALPDFERRKAAAIAKLAASSLAGIKQREAERAAAEAAKPKPAVVAVVSEKFAEAARANPESVRVSARAADDTIVARFAGS